MRTYNITEARQQLGELVNQVKYQHSVIALGQYGDADVLLIPNLPSSDDIPLAAMASSAKSFAFLAAEPDLYSRADLRRDA